MLHALLFIRIPLLEVVSYLSDRDVRRRQALKPDDLRAHDERPGAYSNGFHPDTHQWWKHPIYSLYEQVRLVIATATGTIWFIVVVVDGNGNIVERYGFFGFFEVTLHSMEAYVLNGLASGQRNFGYTPDPDNPRPNPASHPGRSLRSRRCGFDAVLDAKTLDARQCPSRVAPPHRAHGARGARHL